jgi:hypothetical protein
MPSISRQEWQLQNKDVGGRQMDVEIFDMIAAGHIKLSRHLLCELFFDRLWSVEATPPDEEILCRELYAEKFQRIQANMHAIISRTRGDFFEQADLQRIADMFDAVSYVSQSPELCLAPDSVSYAIEKAPAVAWEVGFNLLSFRLRRDGSSVCNAFGAGEKWSDFRAALREVAQVCLTREGSLVLWEQ